MSLHSRLGPFDITPLYVPCDYVPDNLSACHSCQSPISEGAELICFGHAARRTVRHLGWERMSLDPMRVTSHFQAMMVVPGVHHLSHISQAMRMAQISVGDGEVRGSLEIMSERADPDKCSTTEEDANAAAMTEEPSACSHTFTSPYAVKSSGAAASVADDLSGHSGT